MCWLGLKARGQAKPSGIGQAKAKLLAWLCLAPGSGFSFSKPHKPWLRPWLLAQYSAELSAKFLPRIVQFFFFFFYIQYAATTVFL